MRRCGIQLTLGFLLSAVAATVIARPVVVLLTDFGLENEAVGLCHGAILSVDTEIQIVDLSHQVRPFDVRQGSRILGRATKFPRGTVFVAVVDPGVGTDRGSVAVKTTRGFTFVAPNNGLLTDVIQSQGIESVYRIEERKVNAQWEAGTFDGRDL